MKLIALLIFLACFKVSASVYAQSISLNEKNAPLPKVLKQIEQQSGYSFFYKNDMLKQMQKVSITVQDASLNEVLDKCFSNQPFTYEIIDNTIIVKLKGKSVIQKVKGIQKLPINIKGRVTDTTGRALPGAIIKVKGTNIVVIANDNGEYQINGVDENAVLVVTYVGFVTAEIPVSGEDLTRINVMLRADVAHLASVSIVSTGLQTISKERATGSFTVVNSALISRRVSTNLLDRLDGVTSGLYFNGNQQNRDLTYGSSVLGINIRGQSTLSNSINKDPLMVLDNFPYEGNINNLNPNDIESITVLKDAAAASIWGARSGNGVIVITTKKGKLNQKATIEFNASTTIGNKPNLFKDRKFIDASTYIDIEKGLYAGGYFNGDLANTSNYPPLSPVIELLSGALGESEKDSKINSLRSLDYRNDYEKYFYQKSINQQYSLGIRGGSSDNAYALSIGYDKNQDNLIRNGVSRLTVNLQNTYTPIKNFDITLAVNYTNSKTSRDNQLNYGSLSVGGKYGPLYPYAQLADATGNALPVVKDYRAGYVGSTASLGFLDWQYRPLDELKNGDAYDKVNDLLARISLRYKFTTFLNADVIYQNEVQKTDTYDYWGTQTYYARNLINQYSQYDESTKTFSYPFPNGGILNLGNYSRVSNNGRFQLNYDQSFRQDHQVTAIAGTEIRGINTQNYIRTSYGYDDDYGTAFTNINYNTFYPLNPFGFSSIPAPSGLINGLTYHYLSYYANGAYSYKKRYTATLSGRKDGSNIFGAKTNDKVTPLWSAGLGWEINNENFYHVSWLPYLKLRASYGFNGNIYNGSAYTTGFYSTSADLTGAQIISTLTAPNPDLRWEKVKNINFGIDFSSISNRLNGTIELWQKEGHDLINDIPLATSTGFTSVTGNSAATRTKGIDLQLNTENLKGKLGWSTSLLVNVVHDKVIKYNVTQTSTSIQTYSGVALVGKPLYSIYSYKWKGLDPLNGDPQGYSNAQISKDYAGIINNYNPDSLQFNGSARPVLFGSLRNDFRFANFSLSVNIVYKFGYYFRKPSTSINYSDVIGTGGYSDVARRWQKPGDENTTTVPSLIYPSDYNRNIFYQYSSVLVDKGDHIRLQDIRLSYNLTKKAWKGMPFKSCQVYSYANNLGILWRANKDGLDPDVLNSNSNVSPYLPNPFTLAFGLNISL